MTAGIVAPGVGRAPGTTQPRVWTLTFNAPAELMSVNTNKHWRTTSPVRRAWREATVQHAKAAKLPKGVAKIRVEIELRFPTGGRRDAPNYYSYVTKPIIDALGPSRTYTIRKGPRAGLVVHEPGYGMVCDDTAEYVDFPTPTIGPVAGRKPTAPYGEVTVTITDLSGEVTR